MYNNIFSYVAFILLINNLILSLSICPKGMELHSFSESKKLTEEKIIYYKLGDKIKRLKEIYLNFEMDPKELSYVSLILSKDTPKNAPDKDALVFNILSIGDKKGIFLKMQKHLNETHRENEDDMIQIDSLIQAKEKNKEPNEISIENKESSNNIIKFDIYIQNKRIKILHSKAVLFSEMINIENYDYIYLDTKKNKNQKVIKDFTLCYPKNEPNPLRNLQETGESKLDYFEVDNYCIQTAPNILRDGNVNIIPSVVLIPKDKDGNFPSDILNYSKKDLKILFTLNHSKNLSFYYQIDFLKKSKNLVINLECEYPGEIYITSKFFKNNEKYIININNTILDASKTYVYLDENLIVSGSNSIIKIIPINKYGNQMSYVDEPDIKKFQLSIKLSNNTVIKADQAIFDPKEKAIIFNVIIDYIGDIFIEAKYEDYIISCDNCTLYLDKDRDWEKLTDIKYLDTIPLGEVSNLTISPKEEYKNEISAEMIYDILEVKCHFGNMSYEVISKLNKESNNIEIYHKELITSPGIITWQILFEDKELNYTVNITAEAVISNLKFTINQDSLSKEITENNTEISLDVKSDVIIIYELLDLYSNPLYEIDSANISEVQLFGNDMIPISFNIQREGNIFNISIPEKNKEDFHYLVSGENYELSIKVEKDDIMTLFHFNINLTSPENDTGYGNGPYNLSLITFEPDIDLHEITVGETYTLYLIIRTSKNLLYHKDIDINEHLQFNQTFEDKNFIFKASKINSTLGKFLIELYTTKSNENILELDLLFDGEKFEKTINITIHPLLLPNLNNTEIIYYTKHIYKDIEPIKVYLILKDDYNNVIFKKDIAYKKQVLAMIENEAIEQNIDVNEENKTYIISFVSDYHNSNLNMVIYFNNSNDLILLKKDLGVELHVEKFLEPEPIMIDISYKLGVAFLYENIKLFNVSIEIEDVDEDQKTDVETFGDFILYIRNKNYEQSEDDHKLALYTGYLAIVKLSYRNITTLEDNIYLYDKKLINIYNSMRNESNAKRIYELNNTINESSGFIKIDFYENGEIKQMYYPKTENFVFKSVEYLRETASLIIPKISSKLFSDNIQDKFNDLQKDLKEDQSTEEKKKLILRRLSESSTKKNKINRNKVKIRRYRVLEEETNEETYVEDEILPNENDLDIQLREMKNNGDNTHNLTLLSLGDLRTDSAKYTGSLDNKTVLTNIDEEGKVNEIYQKQNTKFNSGFKDESLDVYIYNNTYNDDSSFNKELFTSENETEAMDEESPMKIKSLNSDNINLVKLLDDFSDDNGTLIAHFDSFDFEEMNDTFYENIVLQEMINDNFNGSNTSIEITDEFYEENNALRRLASSNYPYYGQKIANTVKDVYQKSFAGITMRTYTETIIYPHDGTIVANTISIFGSIKKTISSQTTYTNNHIIIKNKNTMTYELVEFLKNRKTNATTYKSNAELTLAASYPSILKQPKPYSYDTLLDDYYKELTEPDKVLNENYQNIYQYIINSKNNIISICNNTENSITDELNIYANQIMNKLQNFINLGVTFNTEILDKIKEKYPNGLQSDDRLILQEISDEISYINNELHKNITNYISNYNSKISQALDIAETEGDITLKAEYEKRANILITNLSNIKYAKYESNKKIKNITEMLKEEIDFNKKSINNLYSDVKLLKTMNSINQENYSTINNSLYNYLEEQFNTEDEDKKINNLKGYLNSIYNNFHKFLFYFYKELSKDVINKLNNIKYNKSESINIQQKLFSITEQILSEYNTPIPDAFLGDIFGEHLAKIEEYFQNYNQTILEYLNLDYEKIASGYDISEEYWNNFKSNLDELINSFKMISQNKDKILEFPQELDYIINTLESFINNDLKLIFEDINNYSKNLLTKKILPLYIKTNLNYITLYHKSNNYYLNKNIEQFSQILEQDNSKGNNHIKLYNDYFEFYSQNIKDQAQSSYISERLDNFILINESVINRYNSEIESGFNEIKSYRESIYDYFNGINNDLTNREKYQNNLMRARLEIMMSYINLFATNLKETKMKKIFLIYLIITQI